jgi:hypothetical protein
VVAGNGRERNKEFRRGISEKEMDEMKIARTLVLAAVTIAAIGASASADSFVWASLDPAGTPAPTGQGQTLDLTCDTSGGPTRCEWLITVWYNTEGSNSAGGWALEIYEDAGPLDKIEIKNRQYLPSPASQSTYNDWAVEGDPNHDGDPSHTLQGAGSSVFSPWPAGIYPLFQFLLSKDKNPGDTNVMDLNFIVGPALFVNNNDVTNLGIGPNAPGQFFGDQDPHDPALEPTIRITNIPEPTTLALLGLGLVGLLRRRR